jgi:HEAT repeats/SMI1 / KNR4 family (SUKH-1)
MSTHAEDSMSDAADPIPRILQKLAEVQRRAPGGFGTEGHGFRLNPPLSEADVAAFEAAHGIRIPEEYRRFLREAGHGGAGPFYGLMPLSEWDLATMYDDVPGWMARPSPLVPEMPDELGWEDALECAEEEIYQGTLALAEQGCSGYAVLVVTGPHRGRVAYIHLEHAFAPHFPRYPNFLAWYEAWLDETLWGYDVARFGHGLPGREEEAAAALIHPASPPPVRRDALAKLACVPRPALSALARLDADGWDAAARAALGDPDADVRFGALSALEEAKRLRRDDVEPFFRSRETSDRIYGIWAAQEVREGGRPMEIPDALLDDPAREVRRAAAFHARDTRARGKVPVLVERLGRETDVDVVSALVQALGALRDPAALPALVQATRHADAFVRQDAARALGELGDARAVPALEALLGDATEPRRHDERGLTLLSSAYTVAEVAEKSLAALRKPFWSRWIDGLR